MKEETIEEKWPHIYQQLLSIKDKLENHFKDVCDVEFVIEDANLFILGVRTAKRSGIANLKFAISFYSEGLIDLDQALSRIHPEDIQHFIEPQINNLSDLQLLGSGLPACYGVATGKIILFSNNARELKEKKEDIILVRNEISPEDIEGVYAANGLLTTRGGMTSHAALTSRGMGKCCVVGFSDLKINLSEKSLSINGRTIKEGEWLSINGSTGKVYMGKADIISSNWRKNKLLLVISKMIELAIRLDIISSPNIGHCWIIRDYFLHNIPIKTQNSTKKSHNIEPAQYIAFKHPSEKKMNSLWNSLHTISHNDRKNYNSILRGFVQALSRIMGNSVGIGNHFKYFRPLLDPMESIKNVQDLKLQLIGLEYFYINRYVPFLIDIYNIKLFLKIEVYADHDLWFLDHTNHRGESIVGNCYDFIAYKILVNEASVDHDTLPDFYNSFRKREYYWKWFQQNETTYHEIVFFLKLSKKERLNDFRLNKYAHDLGLLNNNNLTLSGTSLSNS